MTYVIWHINSLPVAPGVGSEQAVCARQLVEELEPFAWLQNVDVVYCINTYICLLEVGLDTLFTLEAVASCSGEINISESTLVSK